MKLSNKKKFEMPETLPEVQQMTTPEVMPEVSDNQPEVVLTDGQTDNIPPVEQLQAMNQSSDVRQLGLPTMTTIDDKYYTKDEFYDVFNGFFDFLKDPNAAADCFGTIQERGRKLAAGRMYDVAKRYKWLNWLIDKNTAVIHDAALISIWAATEANIIVLNWTGISIFEKGRLWLKSKIKAKAEAEANKGKRNVWAFLGRRAAEKQQKPEN